MASPDDATGDDVRQLGIRDSAKATLKDAPAIDIEPAEPGAWRVTIDGVSRRLWMTRAKDVTWAFYDGRVYRLTEARQGSGRPRVRDDATALAAPMPATVRAVMVKPGDRVEPGATLVVLEAMKMELIIRAPAKGTVRAVRCEPGELVQPGLPLVDLS